MASNNVSVAVRIRPKLQKEQIDMCNICTRVSPDEPQVWLGHDKAFTFDYVFDIASQQFDVYDNCVRTLVDGCFDGFNATVLAYGQTGSGKTYTMGTGFDVSCADDHLGIIPRAVSHLFDGIHARKEEAKANGLPLPEFNVTAQFIEIYNEELIDLLCEKRRKGLQIRIHEDQKRGIILTGVENKTVASADDTLACLKSGSLFRTTGATLMNAESSRSHAIFTLFIKQSRVEHVNGIEDPDSDPQQELVTLTAKFNFVDLAGSERLSRTGAVGERAREGISINSGLLHLGNVISALGDRSKKSSHIPYRDSKLTRVLQDSLGGNSVTTMIACISPCDRDFVETLNTLRYANRAKNIKNKVVANQDSQTQLINELRRQLMQLQVENQELKQGKLFVKNDGELELNDVYLEKEMLQRDLNNANIRNKALNTRLEGLTTENISLRGKLAKHQISIGDAGSDGNDSDEDCAGSLIKGYLKEINTLRSKVIESEYTISYYREQLNKQETKELNDQDQPIDIIERAKYEIELGKSRLFQMNSSINSADSNGNRFSEGADIYDTNGDLSGDEDEVQEEFEKKMADQNAEIATLMEIISSKERLIEEAEAREKRIIELTNHYEQKISSFKSKIKQTEDERDTLISKYKRDNKEDHNSKRLKDEFDRRVAQLQSEVRKYESLKREHDKVLRNETSSKEQLKKLRQEIIETKKKRVQLMGQMREQMNRHNKEMQKSKLVINKLTREDYKKDVKIRDLVVQSNQQKKMLQRREEELKVLRRRVKPMSDRVAGRVSHLKRTNLGHTPQKARNMWHNFEQKFNELVMLRISFDKEEKKLERYLAERQNNINIINTLNKEDHVDGDLNTEYLDNLQVNIDYLSKCIEDSQNMIMQIEEDNFNIEQMFDNCDMSEIMYIVNNLANSAIIYAIRASEKDEELKDKDSKLATLWNENAYSNHLLNYMVSKNFDGEENGVYPPGIVNPLVAVDPGLLTPAKSSNDNKFRRLTMTPSELLYQSNDMEAANQTFIAKQLKKVNEDEDYESSINNHNGQPSPISPNGTFIVDKNFDSTYVKEKSDQKVVPNGNLVRQISDRMTQSLHIEPPPPPSVASSNPTNANQHLNVNAQLNRKASLNGATANSGELFRVPSAPSLKDLNNHHQQFTASTPAHHHHSHHHHHQQQNNNSHLLSPRLLRRKIQQQTALMPPPLPQPLNNNNNLTNNNNNISLSGSTSSSSTTSSSSNKARLIRSISNNGTNGSSNSNNNYYNNCNGTATSNGTGPSNTASATSGSTSSSNNSSANSNNSTSSNHHHNHIKSEYNNNCTSNNSSSSTTGTNIPAASNSYPVSLQQQQQQQKQYNNGHHHYSHHQSSPQASPSLSSSRHAFLHDPYAAAAANQYNGTPPGSPSINRRLNRDTNSMASSITQDSDVFSRLTNTSSMTRQPVEYSVGRIEPASSSKGHDKSFPLVCTHTVVGHRRSVLSVTATNEVLFSGSKDGTARIWDLGQGEEVFSLNDHPDSVNVVRYDEYNKLIFTCSKSIIKIWDPRQKPVNCVHTLCASGMMVDNVVSDSFIHDMRLSADGSTLFSATEKLVRIFDLRTFQPIGKLNTGHKSLVTCLAVDNEDLNDTRIVITGSKDHYVKVFELDGEMSGIHTPKITLNPPHFDGIEALRLTDRGQYLFSGGRDGCIRKWDLTRHRMAASLSNCHRDWVLALNTLPQTSILLSACRSGYLRVWNTENCSPFGEIQAHGSAINDIATIPQVAFTASSDCQIHVWQHRETTASTVNDDSA